jgi:hypothetical protein
MPELACHVPQSTFPTGLVVPLRTRLLFFASYLGQHPTWVSASSVHMAHPLQTVGPLPPFPLTIEYIGYSDDITTEDEEGMSLALE